MEMNYNQMSKMYFEGLEAAKKANKEEAKEYAIRLQIINPSEDELRKMIMLKIPALSAAALDTVLVKLGMDSAYA